MQMYYKSPKAKGWENTRLKVRRLISGSHSTTFYLNKLDNLLNCSEPQCFLENGNNIYLAGLLWRANEIM